MYLDDLKKMRFSCFRIRFLIGSAQKNAMTTSTRTFLMRTIPMQLLHLQFPPNHHALRHPVQVHLQIRVTPLRTLSGWDMCKTMCLAGGTGLEQVITAAVDAMPQAGLPKMYLKIPENI